jgi:hypothetical protein
MEAWKAVVRVVTVVKRDDFINKPFCMWSELRPWHLCLKYDVYKVAYKKQGNHSKGKCCKNFRMK